MMLEAGKKAPEFCLADQDGNQVNLSDFRGKRGNFVFLSKR